MDTSAHPDQAQPDWNAHARALRRLAASLLHGDDARDDVVQDTLLAGLHRPPRALSWPWLASVLRHRAVDRSRRVERRRHHESQVEDHGHAPSSAEIALRLEVHGDLNDAVRHLREPYQRVVYLRYFEDQTPAQIARTLDVPVKTVKTQLARGLALLRERLAHRHGPDLRGLAILVPAWPAPATIAGGAGVLIMVNKIAVLLVAALALFGLWHWLRPADPDSTAALALEAPAAIDAPAGASTAFVDPTERAVRGTAEPAANARAAGTVVASVSLRVHVLWSDGTPAPGVGVRLYGAESRRPGRGLAFLRSDAEGIALFANLPGENLRVRADRGAEAGPIALAEIAPNGVRDVELRFSAGASVSGRVLGPDGAAVPGAEIHIVPGTTHWMGMDCVARSDADGRFDLRDMPPHRSIGATARGFGPSPLVDLEILPGKSPYRTDLVLAAAGGDLVGRVTDPAGEPVKHAWVCVEPPFPANGTTFPAQGSSIRHDGTFAEAPGPRSRACSADGTFRIDGLVPGSTQVHVCASEFALWSSTVKIEAGLTTELRVPLDPGAQLAGVVRDERGLPVAHATVRAFAAAVAPTFVTLGQYDDPDPFGSPVAHTDGEGRYRLGPVWSGEVHAYASPPHDDDARRNGEFPSEFHAEAVLRPEAGQVLTWNPVLSPGHTIQGRVTFADGTPMPEVFINANPREESGRLVTRTDEAGTFAFYNLAVEPFRIEVQVWASPPGSAPLARDDVWPDQGEVALVATYDDPRAGPRARVTGQVVDAAGQVPEGTSVNLSGSDGVTYFCRRCEGGRFLFEDVAKGEYALVVVRGEDALYVGERFQIAAGESLDAGTLRLAPDAKLTVRIERAGGTSGKDTLFFLRRAGWDRGHYVEVGDRHVVVLDRLTNGTYQLNWWGGGCAQGERTITLERETEVVLRPSPGVTCGFDVHFPKAGAGRVLDLVVGVVGQETTYREHVEADWNATSPFHVEIQVPVGTYAVAASTDTGLKAVGELVVRAGEVAAPAVRLDLR